jgi:hypothetical protein
MSVEVHISFFKKPALSFYCFSCDSKGRWLELELLKFEKFNTKPIRVLPDTYKVNMLISSGLQKNQQLL